MFSLSISGNPVAFYFGENYLYASMHFSSLQNLLHNVTVCLSCLKWNNRCTVAPKIITPSCIRWGCFLLNCFNYLAIQVNIVNCFYHPFISSLDSQTVWQSNSYSPTDSWHDSLTVIGHIFWILTFMSHTNIQT